MESEPSKKHANSIIALDALSVHRISSGQVVVDLQTAVKELVENSLDAGATNIEVRFKEHGLEFIEVVDNGCGIAAADYDSVGLKHHTSKLDSFEALEGVSTFGFRGEALSSLCALCSSVTVTTATEKDAPMGTVLELDRLGKVKSRSGKVARQRGTTVTISEIFKPLPVRRKELERNAKREFGKALNLLNAYALVPCAQENGGVRLTCTHQPKGGKKSVQLRTDGSSSVRSSVSALWGPKTLENLVELDLSFDVETEKAILRRQGILPSEGRKNTITVRGLISKFALNCGRNGSDRQFYYINGRPCNPSKVPKAFNEVYKTFNATQSPMVIADFILPKGCIDVNVSPDKRTILIHSEDNLVQALKAALEDKFASERSTYNVAAAGGPSQVSPKDAVGSGAPKSLPSKAANTTVTAKRTPLFQPESSEDEVEEPRAVKESDKKSVEQKETGKKNVKGKEKEDGFGEPVLLVPEPEPEPEVEEVEMLDGAAEPITTPKGKPKGKAPRGAREELQDQDDTPIDVDDEADRVDEPKDNTPPEAESSSSPVPLATQRRARKVPEIAIQQIEPPRASQPYGRVGKQLVFNKSGEFWHLSPSSRSTASSSSSHTHGDTRPRKRLRTSESEQANKLDSTNSSFKLRMAGFAMSGSQVTGGGGASGSRDDADEINSGTSGDKVTREEQDDEDDGDDADEPTASNAPPESSKKNTPATRDEGSDIVMETSFDVESEVSVSSRMTSSRRDDTGRHTNVEASPETGANAEDEIMEISSQDDTNGEVSPEYVRTAPLETSVVHYDEDALMHRWANRRIHAAASTPSAANGNDKLVDRVNTTNATEDDDAAASETLSRVINKADFATMDVIGQFNLGFIIARRRQYPLADGSQAQAESTRDDLFIIDQHAADEKYNFEQLQQTTRIESQSLFRPKPLELTAADELVAIENIDVLRRNGFEIEIDDDGDSRPGGGGHRLHLVAQPVSKTTVFDMRDLEELLHLLRDSPRGQVVRCSKARSMFAMRACRKSIMVGMPLQHKQMTSVVRHMGTMDQPWNCPHGRPTMRHLADISNGGRKHLYDRSIRWNDFE